MPFLPTICALLGDGSFFISTACIGIDTNSHVPVQAMLKYQGEMMCQSPNYVWFSVMCDDGCADVCPSTIPHFHLVEIILTDRRWVPIMGFD